MVNFSRFKPEFWDYHDAASGPRNKDFSFRRNWLTIVVFTMAVTLTPLLVMAVADYRFARQATETAIKMDVSKTVASILQNLSSILSQRRSALTFIARDNALLDLSNPKRLHSILTNLQRTMDGFIDLTVVNGARQVLAYAGPGEPGERLSKTELIFDDSLFKGSFISDVAENGSRGRRFVMAAREDRDKTGTFFLQASLDAEIFEKPIAELPLDEGADAFIVNDKGVYQTQPRYGGVRYEPMSFPLPDDVTAFQVLRTKDHRNKPVFLHIAPVPSSPFLFVMVRQEPGIIDLWVKPRIRLLGFLCVSVVVISIVVMGVATYLVNRIHAADRRRIQALHQVEYANKMSSIGRLASGVAHEVNNPLAIINQKTGLLKDLLVLGRNTAGNEKIVGLVDDVLASVQRCGAITRRMLDFAQHMESSSMEEVDIEAIIRQILAFMGKEAQLKGIELSLTVKGDVPQFYGDRGNLQQIFLNVINNAFAAMEDGGSLKVAVKRKGLSEFCVTVSDTGHGIPHKDLKRVFEPFFSTRQGHAGTGLGLSVTYGLVSEMGGEIVVESQVNQGTCFTVRLPLEPPRPG